MEVLFWVTERGATCAVLPPALRAGRYSPGGLSWFLRRAPALYNPACGFRAGEVQVFEPVLRLAMRPVVSPCGLC